MRGDSQRVWRGLRGGIVEPGKSRPAQLRWLYFRFQAWDLAHGLGLHRLGSSLLTRPKDAHPFPGGCVHVYMQVLSITHGRDVYDAHNLLRLLHLGRDGAQ